MGSEREREREREKREREVVSEVRGMGLDVEACSHLKRSNHPTAGLAGTNVHCFFQGRSRKSHASIAALFILFICSVLACVLRKAEQILEGRIFLCTRSTRALYADSFLI